MTVIVRRFASRPRRTSTETWEAISKIIVGDNTRAKLEFGKVEGVSACLISEEYLDGNPMVVISTSGPRIRVYCLYGEDALIDDDANEAPLPSSPTTELEWNVYLPCSKEEIEEMEDAFKSRSAHFHVYDLTKGLDLDDTEKMNKSRLTTAFEIDREGFKRL